MKIAFLTAFLLQIAVPKLDTAYPRLSDGAIFKDEAKAVHRVDRWLSDPEALRSRLQMYWDSHATEVFIEGEQFHHAGGAPAPVPTVRYVANRGGESAWRRPALEDVPPYQDSLGMWMINKKDGTEAWVDPKMAGGAAGSINNEIMSIARDAAALYHLGRGEKYAELAAVLFDTYMQGIYWRDIPVDLAHGHQQTLVGPTSFEVIHENVIVPCAECYDYLHDYLSARYADRIDIYEEAFRKWMDAIIAGGVPHNNWNLIQAQFVLRAAMVIRDDESYADGRGRRWYLNEILNGNSIRQWSIGKLIDYGFDKEAGVWTECPNYSTMVMEEFSSFVNLVEHKMGIRLQDHYPVLEKAIRTIPQYYFPNGMMTSWGDTYYTPGKRKYFVELEGDMSDWQTPVFWSPGVSWFAARSGNDPANSLMMSVAGSEGNHMHANGISMELYGKGYVQGVDSGRGSSYTALDHSEYYAQFPAHNTVCVDGVSSYTHMQSHHPFKLLSCYPEPLAREYQKGIMYGDFSFLEPETYSDQRRQLVMVTAHSECGYYVDIFRSGKREGGDRFHDYFYHNIGTSLELSRADGEELGLEATEELSFAGASIYAYSYLWDKRSALCGQTVTGKFTMNLPGGGENGMKFWAKGDEDRRFFTALSPKINAFRGTRTMPYDAYGEPCRTFVTRQYGEAWDRPFVVVYQPYQTGDTVRISSVDFKGGDCEQITVTLSDGTVHRIISSVCSSSVSGEGLLMDGSLAVICPERVLLRGRRLSCILSDGTRVDINSGEDNTVSLMKEGGSWTVESTAVCKVKIDGKKLK